jgi:hypothetical protein
MPLRIGSLWREPLLRFLLLGFALFVYYGATNGEVEGSPKSIRVERGQVQHLAGKHGTLLPDGTIGP